MSNWGEYPAVAAGLIALLLVAGTIALRNREGVEEPERFLLVLNAGGLAATLLFMLLLLARLAHEFIQVVQSYGPY